MNWDNISIGQYQKIHETKASGMDLLSIVTGLSVDELENIPIKRLKKYISDYEFLNTEPTGTLTDWEGYKILSFKEKGKFGQLIDFLSILENPDYILNLHLIISTVLVKSNDLDFEEKTEFVQNNCPITIAIGTADFFFQNFNRLKAIILDYTPNKSKAMNHKKQKLVLRTFINGISGWIGYQTKTNVAGKNFTSGHQSKH
jgi:hypothetical protein